MSLDAALNQLEATETTLRRLEGVEQRLASLVPDGIAFIGSSPEGAEYENLRRAFGELANGLPSIEGWTITDYPLGLDDIAQNRLDAQEVGEIDAIVWAERGVAAPGEAVREYRFRFSRLRRSLVRERVHYLLDQIPSLLSRLTARVDRDNEPVSDTAWVALTEAIGEVERLLGSSIVRKGRWTDLHRHLSFAQGCDVHDIAEHDWPSVLPDIRSALYDEYEPMPVEVADLADLVAAGPRGSVSTKLRWDALDGEGFERLVFNLINDAPGYENAQWLTRTNAPDRGRDLSVDRVVPDSLSGTTRQRVIIQCKHWLARSISPTDVTRAVTGARLWEPPPVDVLIIVTSGRFSADAVALVERHNAARERPTIEMWPESHLESLLAQRPHLVSPVGLRPAARV